MTVYGPYPATVLAEHDGDTVTLAIDLGFDITFRSACRFFGINAPELNTPEGKDAVAYLRTILSVGDQVVVTSHGWDKYGGRFDGVIVKGSVDINQAMVTAGHAVERSY